MNTFVSGGCKNGKSMFAQRLAFNLAKKSELPLYYLATMIPIDGEDDARILRHRKERDGWGFKTIEQGLSICECLENPDVDKNGVFLLDSVTALLSNEMFAKSEINLDAGSRTAHELCEFAKKTGNTIFVSDFIYGEMSMYDEITEIYRKSLAQIDRKLAIVCENVVEYSYGVPFYYKEGR
ncbi:MAG: bifunctional adenosylcobinamide kinase/adenosylcobinamide-phosphate guanylyltransferase [Eubacteriales bacterium]